MKFFSNLLITTMIVMSFMACQQKAEKAVVVDNDSVYADTAVVCDSYIKAIDYYLTNEFGKQYSQGDVCIPFFTIVGVDEHNADNILVWGDYWVFNYQLIGDLLRTVSGGSHAGLMHVRQTGETFEVTGFDAVTDGAGNLESAKKIFGDKYDDFHRVNSDADKREATRNSFIARYVKDHHLAVQRYQDEGWPAVAIKE